jgi:hypothetical protein
MNRAEQLTADLKAHNNGLHYLKAKDRTECVDELCAEIDQLRSQLTAAGDMAKALEPFAEMAKYRTFPFHGQMQAMQANPSTSAEPGFQLFYADFYRAADTLARWYAANKGGVV